MGVLLVTASGIVYARRSNYWGVGSCKCIGGGQSEVSVGPTSTGVESADIVAAEMRSAPLKPSKSPLYRG